MSITILASSATATADTGMYEFVQQRESRARTYATRLDRVFAEASGTRLYDSEGRPYLDCLAAAGTLALGHNHPYVVHAVTKFLRSNRIQQGLDLTTPAKYEFLRKLYEILPPEFAGSARVQFCGPSGADAVEAALKLFKTATGRNTVLAFHGAYHGMTGGSLALTGNLAAKTHIGSLLPDVHYLPYPYPYRCPFGLGEAGADASLAYVQHVLTDPESGITKPAALLLEAVQGEGGVIPAPAEWLRGLRRITAEADVPLVVDEIQTGFGRTGDMFAFEAAGIEPDAIVVSKAVGGGYPLSLLLYHEKYDLWSPGAHAGTFRGNQIAMVAGAATLDVLTGQELITGAREKGEYLRSRLLELAGWHPAIGDVRGRGLMWGLEIVDPGGPADRLGSLPPDGARARAIQRACLDSGMILETGGRHGAVIRLLPPLIIERAELDEAVEKLDHALAVTGSGHSAG
jgi:diaminobutyrate-2-oxoglutarate transaminase